MFENILRLPGKTVALFGLPLLLAFPSISTTRANSQPNFVFIALDDLVPVSLNDTSSANSLLRMLAPFPRERRRLSARIAPNINRLAARGLTFTGAWTNYPRCNASRAAVLTGISAMRSGYIDEHSAPLRAPDSSLRNATTLPERFRLAGYQTFGVGKIFHFSNARYGPGGAIEEDWPDIARSWTGYLEMDVGTLERIRPAPNAGHRDMRFGTERNPTALQPDWINATLMSGLLRNGSVQTVDSHSRPASLALQPGKPFFLGLGLRRPHAPFAVPKEWLERVPISAINHARINLAGEMADLGDLTGVAHGPEGPMRTMLRYDGTSRSMFLARRRLLDYARHYLATIAFADACVGQLLNALEASPYANNTVVVLWSDHGLAFGQKLQLGKCTLWEPSLRAEFIIADLRNGRSGARREPGPVSLLDIYPTMCELAGIGVGEEPLDGRSLVSALEGRGLDGNVPVFASYLDREFAVRKGSWKYITHRAADRGDELYNLQQDPFERHNLLCQPNNHAREVAIALRTQVERQLLN